MLSKKKVALTAFVMSVVTMLVGSWVRGQIGRQMTQFQIDVVSMWTTILLAFWLVASLRDPPRYADKPWEGFVYRGIFIILVFGLPIWFLMFGMVIWMIAGM